jgi:hypothetical protein
MLEINKIYRNCFTSHIGLLFFISSKNIDRIYFTFNVSQFIFIYGFFVLDKLFY